MISLMNSHAIYAVVSNGLPTHRGNHTREEPYRRDLMPLNQNNGAFTHGMVLGELLGRVTSERRGRGVEPQLMTRRPQEARPFSGETARSPPEPNDTSYIPVVGPSERRLFRWQGNYSGQIRHRSCIETSPP